MSFDNRTNLSKGPNLADILLYLLSKWPWYVLALVLCLAFSWYRSATAPLVYYAQSKVIIKDPSNKTSTGGLDRYDNSINRVNVTNEILQLRSKRLLQEVVARTRADVSYTTRRGLRDVNIYGVSPVEVTFPSVKPGASMAFTLEPLDSAATKIILHAAGGESYSATLVNGKLYKVWGEKIVVRSTPSMSPSWYGKEINVRKESAIAAVNRVAANLGIRQEEKDGTIINIAVTSGSPELDIALLNAIVQVYNEESINDKNQVAVNTANFIDERLQIIGHELGGVETELESYRRDNQVVDIGSMMSRYMGESARYSADALQYDTQLRIALFIKEYLTDPARAADLIPTNLGINDQAIESQISQYNSVKLQRDRLKDESSEANPVIEELNNTLGLLRENILRAIDNIIVSIEVKRRDARGYEGAAESRIATIPRKQREMLSIERQQKIKESLYLFLLNRREENALSQAMADNNARIIEGPEGSVARISPDRNRILLLGGLAGLFIPTVIILLSAFMNTRVRGRRDIKEAVSVPYLGEVPLNSKLGARRPLFKSRKTHEEDTASMNALMGDAYRMVLANIRMIAKARGKEANVLMTTSFREGAGKTFTIVNMAEALAAGGKKVVLVDLDIRKGTLSHRAGVKHGTAGLTNYLYDDSVTVDDIIVKRDGQPDLIPAGIVPPNPVELLSGNRLDELFAELRKRYDYVLADCVPVGIVADATVANRVADLSLFIIRVGSLDRRQLPDIQSLYDEGALGPVGIILNGVELHGGYGYGYSYGYGYGYGYGHYGYGYGRKRHHRRRLRFF